MRRLLCVVCGHGLIFSLPVFAQEAIDFSTYTPRVEPVRIDRTDAPRIDGDLSDPAWAKAAVIDTFFQVEPLEGVPPTEKTEVFMVYDERALYVAIKAYDSNPDAIRRTILTRDGEVWRDDMVRFYIDPFDTGISGFGFDVNGLGARADRLVQARRAPVDEWDTIWDSAGRITDEGWQAEFVLPFRSINFDPEAESWGLMLTRELAHKNEEIRWAGIDRSVNKFGFDRPGRLAGITDVDKGVGLDVEVLAALRLNRDWERPRDDDARLSPSGNIYYQFTPSLTGLATINTDFSDTPLDAQQIQTGRFSLFFPETRDFFLQDAAFFEFGGATFNGAPNGQPFFSRRIGIVGGRPVTLDVGAKLSGEVAGVEIGALTTRMGDRADLEPQTLSVGRAAVDVLADSRLGVIATYGDPTGETENTVVGTDFLYQDRQFRGAGLLQADAFYLHSRSELGASEGGDGTTTEGDSYGLRIAYPNERWNWSVSARHVGEDFAPALGFVNRPGTDTLSTRWRRRWRPSLPGIRWVQAGTETEEVTTARLLLLPDASVAAALDGDIETRRRSLNAEFQTIGTDETRLALYQEFERVDFAFSLPGGLIVPAGAYDNDGAQVIFRSSWIRPYGLELDVERQDFFGGRREAYDIRLAARPSPYFNIAARYGREEISVPTGDVIIDLGSVDAVINLSPDLSITTQTQYNTVSEQLSFFSRLRWEIRPETEVFVSLGHGAFIRAEDFPGRFESIQSSAIFRIGNRFRF